jgi:hypothetical protein
MHMRLTARGAGCLAAFAVLLLVPTNSRADRARCDAFTPPPAASAATVYEVAEWGFLRGKYKPRSRQATATLVGTVEAGAPICPKTDAMTPCNLTILASDDVSLTTGYGPAEGEFFVLKQDDNPVDGPEFIVLEGRLVNAVINLAPAFFQGVPVGYLCGQWETTSKGSRLRGKVTGMFQLPFVFPPAIPAPSYVVNPALFPNAGCCEPISAPAEQSLGAYTVRLKLYLSAF